MRTFSVRMGPLSLQHKTASIFGGAAAVLFATAYLVTVSGALKSRPVLWPLLLLAALGAAVIAFLWNWEALSGRRGLAFVLGSILAVSPALGVLAAAAPEALSYRFFPQAQQGSNLAAPSDDQLPPADPESSLTVADPSDIVDGPPVAVDPWPTWESDVRRAEARCDAVDASVPVKVETVTITELLGPVTLDYLRFENGELLEGRTLHLESVDRTGLIAAMVRGEQYFTEFFTFDLDDPTRLTKIGSHPGIAFHPRPVDDPQVRRPDATKARELLGWEATTPLAVGLAHTAAWWKQQRAKRAK